MQCVWHPAGLVAHLQGAGVESTRSARIAGVVVLLDADARVVVDGHDGQERAPGAVAARHQVAVDGTRLRAGALLNGQRQGPGDRVGGRLAGVDADGRVLGGYDDRASRRYVHLRAARATPYWLVGA